MLYLLGDLLAGLPRYLAALLARDLAALLARHLAGHVDALLTWDLVAHLTRDLAALLSLNLIALLSRHLESEVTSVSFLCTVTLLGCKSQIGGWTILTTKLTVIHMNKG